MADHFTDRFIDDAEGFKTLHEKLKTRGYVTGEEEPHLNRPCHNSFSEERYQAVFEMHYPTQYAEVQPAVAVFENENSFPDFYVIYDSAHFEDREALGVELRRFRILK